MQNLYRCRYLKISYKLIERSEEFGGRTRVDCSSNKICWLFAWLALRTFLRALQFIRGSHARREQFFPCCALSPRVFALRPLLVVTNVDRR